MAITTKNITNLGGALIGYENLLTSVSVTGDTSDTESKSLIKNTYERWRPDNIATVARFALTGNADVNFVGIAGHNLSGQEITIQYATTGAGALTDIAVITPSNNDPIFITFDDVNVAEIAITATFANDKEIAVVYAGKYLQMPRSIFGGHKPIGLNPKTSYQSNNSESGQFLGRSIIRQGLETSYAWRYLTSEFVRGDFRLFVESVRRYPFFIQWRPDKYVETAFGYTTKDVMISNMGGAHGLMSATLTMKGHADVV